LLLWCATRQRPEQNTASLLAGTSQDRSQDFPLFSRVRTMRTIRTIFLQYLRVGSPRSLACEAGLGGDVASGDGLGSLLASIAGAVIRRMRIGGFVVAVFMMRPSFLRDTGTRSRLQRDPNLRVQGGSRTPRNGSRPRTPRWQSGRLCVHPTRPQGRFPILEMYGLSNRQNLQTPPRTVRSHSFVGFVGDCL
jgi:hypothetical protein